MTEDLRDLHRELRAFQRRLGTPSELDGDFDRVLSIAHRINNGVTEAYLRAAATSAPAAVSLSAVCRDCLNR